MARPPKPAAERKDYHLRVPLNEAQHALIKQAVELADQDKAEWARAILLDAAKRMVAKSGRDKTDRA